MARHPQISRKQVHGHPGILLDLDDLVLNCVGPLMAEENPVPSSQENARHSHGDHKLDQGQSAVQTPKRLGEAHCLFAIRVLTAT